MKLELPERQVESSFKGKTISYKIDDSSPIIFDTLRRSLYSDPIGSICRELTSNAYDAHVENDCPDKPIEVGVIDDQLIIRDSGPGISPHRIEHIYCWYGGSTKRDSNREIGAFGLGAKTPFAYKHANSFTIETVYDNVKYTYLAYIDETGKGKIQSISECLTNEGSSTTIQLPLQSSDTYKFKNKLRYYTQFWPVQPIFLGDLEREPLKPEWENDKWATYTTNVPLVTIGNIPYEVDIYSLGLSYKEMSFLRNVRLKFNIGELSITAGREKLHMDESTEKKIKERVKEVLLEADKYYIQQIQQQTKFKNVVPLLGKLLTRNTFTWMGYTIQYPPETMFRRSYCYTSRARETVCPSGFYVHESPNREQIILCDKPRSRNDNARIKQYANDNNFREVWITTTDFGIGVPIETLPPVRNNKKTSTKTEIMCWKDPTGTGSYQTPIDRMMAQVYWFRSSRQTQKGYYRKCFQINCVYIRYRDRKLIGNNDKWIDVEKFFYRELAELNRREEDIIDHVMALDLRSMFNGMDYMSQFGEFWFFRDTNLEIDGKDRILAFLKANGRYQELYDKAKGKAEKYAQYLLKFDSIKMATSDKNKINNAVMKLFSMEKSQ